MELPRPSANRKEYDKVMKRGFLRFPRRKKNYEEYLKSSYNEVVNTAPIKMDYEVSNKCNFRCTMCLLWEVADRMPPTMKYEDFAKSIEEQYGLIEVKLQGLGEPLLNPDFFNMVDLCVSKDIWVRTITNGSMLNINENYKKLVDKKIGEISISIDGATKETFEKIRVGSNFEQVVYNATLLNSYAAEKGEQWRTSCWMLVQQDNYTEMEAVLELAARMRFTRLTYSIEIGGFGLEEWKAINDAKSVKQTLTEKQAKHLIERGKELGIEVTFWDGSDKYMFDEKKDKICNWLFSRAFISADMKIVPCCEINYAETCCLGCANDFFDEWNNESYREIRKAHLLGKIPEMCKACYQENMQTN